MIDEESFAIFVEHVSRACHQAIKSYCEEALNDSSQPDWEYTAKEVREATYSGVIFCLEHPEATQEQLHMNWKRDKIKAGWIYGPTKNETARMHPFITSYDQLPDGEKVKAEISLAVVDAFRETFESQFNVQS